MPFIALIIFIIGTATIGFWLTLLCFFFFLCFIFSES